MGSFIKRIISSSLAAMLLLSGCGSISNEDTLMQQAEVKESMLTEPVLLSETPVTYPKILVDESGYLPTSDKTAVLAADLLPAEFNVIDKKTGKIVYEGKVSGKDTGDEADTLYGIADFSDLTKEGTYYIETEILGKSKEFTITTDKYESLYISTLKRLESMRCENCHTRKAKVEGNEELSIDVSGGLHTDSDDNKDVVEGCLAVMDICTALEYYPSVFSDDIIIALSGNKIPDILDEAIYEVEWLLKMQNQKTGGVYASVVYSEEDSQVKVVSETTKATAYFAASMAKFSITVKKYDAELSKKAFQAAALAWKCLEANKDIVTNEQRFRAAVEMYRASGSGVYNRVILDYLKDNADKDFESDSVLDGAITYLNTTRSVNMDYCASLMSTFMDRTEEKINLAESNPYGIESEELSAEELLRNMFELIIVDYIISSNAYTETEEDYMHYLGGRNFKSAYLIDDINTPDSLVRLIAFSAKLSAELEKEEDVK